jgi:very-short-patch-repair endonuclease
MDKLKEIQWPIPIKRLAELLGTSRVRIQNMRIAYEDEFIKNIDFKWAPKPGSPRHMVIFKEGAIKIAEKLSTEGAANFLENEGVKKKKKITPESHYIGIIKEAIGNLTKTMKQYPVDGYKIDLYLPNLKLAVECDEQGHKNYDIVEHNARQVYIEKKEQCSFIRFNPHEKNFNVGHVINKIFIKIIENKANTASMKDVFPIL